MLVSTSEGFCLDGLFGAILFSAAFDILNVMMANVEFRFGFVTISCGLRYSLASWIT